MTAGEAGGYHASRLTYDPKRTIVWDALWRYHFRHCLTADFTVLDMGAGHGGFINSVTAHRRIAMDVWDGMQSHLAPGVEAIIGPVTDLTRLEDGSIDYAFASNLFEHLSQAEFAKVLAGLRSKLSSRGTLTILQPNYRYCAREYFDDYTHVTVWSHVSLADFLAANGYEVLSIRPRFLPLTVKSRLPVRAWLVGAYLAAPLKPLGKQMLLVAKPR